ncbi:glycosyltransferase family 2 protein [Prochlorococcus marinus XMU1412]|uniref:glycosyltransferase family 2 protein n=1 Tax=Prochlorococcus marinus TaxID=1219 RepID=UPI001ADB895A|nr:glycosyltransferase family 2 protein [Prochlorococcus marinus]MBO8240542.1 glycosyltransferase family 2 protein [Prochlorococcus marinus XMU1412]MBW3071777.1 glycosyl transferase family 2 [Prochlorococcus marinus str. MU1412]
MRFSLIIPCFNESKNLKLIIERVYSIFLEKDIELILVDNGSTDDSRIILGKFLKIYPFLKVVFIKKNIGYGHGILEGLRHAKGKILGWTHADLQTDPLDFIKALENYSEKLNNSNFFIKGRRIKRPFFDSFFTFSMSIFESILFREVIYDVNAQPTLFHRDFYKSWVNPPEDFAIDLYVYFLAKKNRYNIYRFPVNFSKRIFGISSWNYSLKSKWIFILRTINYSLRLNFLKNK